MFRKLSLALAVSAALSSTGALALGLGEISTRSALNENFDADIAMVSVDPGELESIKVTLASPADFASRGLDRPYLLSKLRFKPIELDDGRSVIRVTSKEAVREPFLNFLVEVNWPKGRLIREFTVLLDPPLTGNRMSTPVTPVVTASAETPEPGVQRTAPTERYVAVPVVAPLPPLPPGATAGEYGPVPRGATLWRIATEMAIPGATTEQVVMALFRANPGAFAGNNVNNLLAGSVLRIPTEETIFSQSPREAKAQFRSQTRSWTGPEGAPPPSAGRLEIAGAPPEGAPGGDMERVKTDLMMVKETGESNRQETEELRSRIRELEAQLADIRQLLKLKSDQLAALQAGQSMPAEPVVEEVEEVEETPELAGVEEPPVETEGEVEVVEEVVEEAEAVEAVEAPGAEPEAVTPVEETPTEPVVAEAPVEEPETKQEPVAVQLPEKAPPAAAPAATPKTPVPAPAPEQGLVDNLFSNPIVLGIGAAVVVVLLSLVWLLIKRRRETEGQFDESVLLAPNDSTTVELDRESEVAESAGHDEETSFISDFSPSDIDALQEETGEVDPAAEADVYIAYGRYQQAESLINQAIDKNPDRLDLKMKLAEIYFTTRNVRAFTDLAEQMESANAPEQDPQLWARVQSMGRELVPGHQLFGAAEVEDEGLAPESTIGSDTEELLVTDSEAMATMDLDLDTELSALQEASQEASAFNEGTVLEPPAPPPEKVADKGQEEDSEFAIDLSDLDTLEDIDIGDLSMDTEELVVEPPPKPAAAEPAPPVAGEPETVLNESEFELSEFDLGPQEGSGLASEPLSDVLEEGGEEEDTGTKLDLARAYLEMGDSEGAKEFLDEVLEEGNEEQKAQAKALLEKID